MRSPARPIHPARICRDLNELLTEDAVLVADTGFSSIWTGTMVEFTQPGQRYLRAAGSLGWGLPASLGAKCALPGQPVICFCGDGGAWYHLSELETARRCGIRTVTIINNNSSLLQGQASIDRAYGDRTGAREELYRYRDTNFARIAVEMGCRGIRVESPEEIRQSLKDALASDLPVVIDVVTDRSFTPAKAWTPT